MGTMRVVDCLPDLEDRVWRLLDSQYRAIHPERGVSRQVFADAVAGIAPWSLHYPELKAAENHRIRVVLEGEKVLAAASLSGHIEWLCAEADGNLALALLLEDVSNVASDASLDGRAHFGSGWFGVPSCWPQVESALARAGFHITEQWRTFTVPLERLISIPLDTLDFPVDFLTANSSELGEWHLEAHVDEELAGECHVWDLPWLPGAAGEVWADLEWIGVEGPFRERGLAARLIQEQARFHHGRGVTGFAACIEAGNEHMQHLADGLGFVPAMECRKWRQAS